MKRWDKLMKARRRQTKQETGKQETVAEEQTFKELPILSKLKTAAEESGRRKLTKLRSHLFKNKTRISFETENQNKMFISNSKVTLKHLI